MLSFGNIIQLFAQSSYSPPVSHKGIKKMPLFSKVAETGEQISFVIYKKDTKAVGEKRSRVSPLHSRASSFCEIQGGGGK